MVDINDLSMIERDILALFAKRETTNYCFEANQKDLNLTIEEVEKAVNGLVEKGMAKIKHESQSRPPYNIYCSMEYGISHNWYVDLKEIEEAKWEELALRDRVCP